MRYLHTMVRVRSIEQSLRFYCEGLGLTLKRRLSPTWIELAGANCPIYLLANRPAVADLGSTTAVRSHERHWMPVHLDFVVSDRDATVSWLTARAGSLDRDIETREYGRIANMAQQVAYTWTEMAVPVIAAVHGVALGGGIQIALGADIRIVAPDAKLSVLEIRWGLLPDTTVSDRSFTQ